MTEIASCAPRQGQPGRRVVGQRVREDRPRSVDTRMECTGASRSRWSSPAGQSTAPGSRMTWLNAAGRSRQQILSFMQYPVEICLNSLKI